MLLKMGVDVNMPVQKNKPLVHPIINPWMPEFPFSALEKRASGGLFGNSTGGSVFGGPSAPSSGLFGNSTGSSLFGGGQSGGLFGRKAAAEPRIQLSAISNHRAVHIVNKIVSFFLCLFLGNS